MNIHSLIDQIQAQQAEQKKNPFYIQGGGDIQVSGGGGSWSVSNTPSALPNVYTIQICVDGVAKNLDVYVKGAPY